MYRVHRHFRQEKIFANVATCSHWWKLIMLIFVHIKDCIEAMATLTALAKVFSIKHFCNTAKNSRIQYTQSIMHTYTPAMHTAQYTPTVYVHISVIQHLPSTLFTECGSLGSVSWSGKRYFLKFSLVPRPSLLGKRAGTIVMRGEFYHAHAIVSHFMLINGYRCLRVTTITD